MSYERDNIRRMTAYQWGEQPETADILKLNTNENPYPPSPAVQQALDAFTVDQLRRYPPPTADGLRRQLANEMGFVMPPVRIRDNVHLPPNEYRLRIRGAVVGEGTVLPDHLMAMDSGVASGIRR